MLIALNGVAPRIDPTAYVQSSARVVADVHIGPHSSVWFYAVIRGDVHEIRLGTRTNVQDHATIHVMGGRHGTHVGDDVTIGHAAVLHGCTVGDRCLIGIGAIVLDGCTIGDDCLIGAGALLTPGTAIEPGQLVLGSPARAVRPLTDPERAELLVSSARYVANLGRYRAGGVA